jgi:hypothetical protein
MVGATAFMETLELAVELQRARSARTASASASTSIRTIFAATPLMKRHWSADRFTAET